MPFTSEEIKSLTLAKIKDLTIDQIKSIKVEQLRLLTKIQIQAFSITQLNALISNRIKALTFDQRKALNGDSVHGDSVGTGMQGYVAISNASLDQKEPDLLPPPPKCPYPSSGRFLAFLYNL